MNPSLDLLMHAAAVAIAVGAVLGRLIYPQHWRISLRTFAVLWLISTALTGVRAWFNGSWWVPGLSAVVVVLVGWVWWDERPAGRPAAAGTDQAAEETRA
ncbi:hypothetical protein SUDANB1_05600 [Streptomyces sp. enrichment culture]|uniref:hypothetical protein n=1 Tax=Streptomyces sp. enrichment culture TaxID=1795815 RepID=UPI003F54D064